MTKQVIITVNTTVHQLGRGKTSYILCSIHVLISKRKTPTNLLISGGWCYTIMCRQYSVDFLSEGIGKLFILESKTGGCKSARTMCLAESHTYRGYVASYIICPRR